MQLGGRLSLGGVIATCLAVFVLGFVGWTLFDHAVRLDRAEKRLELLDALRPGVRSAQLTERLGVPDRPWKGTFQGRQVEAYLYRSSPRRVNGSADVLALFSNDSLVRVLYPESASDRAESQEILGQMHMSP